MTERQVTQSTFDDDDIDLPSLAVVAGGSSARRRGLLPFGNKRNRDQDDETRKSTGGDSQNVAQAERNTESTYDDVDHHTTAHYRGFKEDESATFDSKTQLTPQLSEIADGGDEDAGLSVSTKMAHVVGMPTPTSKARGNASSSCENSHITDDNDHDDDDSIPLDADGFASPSLPKRKGDKGDGLPSPHQSTLQTNQKKGESETSSKADLLLLGLSPSAFASPRAVPYHYDSTPKNGNDKGGIVVGDGLTTPVNAVLRKNADAALSYGTNGGSGPYISSSSSATVYGETPPTARRFVVPPPPASQANRETNTFINESRGDNGHGVVASLSNIAAAPHAELVGVRGSAGFSDGGIMATPRTNIVRNEDLPTPQTSLTQLTQEALLSQALEGTSSSQSLLVSQIGNGPIHTVATVAPHAVDVTPLNVQLTRVNEPQTIGRSAEAAADYAPPSPNVGLFSHFEGFTPLQSQNEAPQLRRNAGGGGPTASSLSAARSSVRNAAGGHVAGRGRAGPTSASARAQLRNLQLNATAAAAVDALTSEVEPSAEGLARVDGEAHYGDGTGLPLPSPTQLDAFDQSMLMVMSPPNLGRRGGGARGAHADNDGAMSPSIALELNHSPSASVPISNTQRERRESERWCQMAKNFFDFIDQQPLKTAAATAPILAAVAAKEKGRETLATIATGASTAGPTVVNPPPLPLPPAFAQRPQ